MKNIIMFLNRILLKHNDKVKHFFCSYTAMLTFTSIAIIKWESPITWSINFGIGSGRGAGGVRC